MFSLKALPLYILIAAGLLAAGSARAFHPSVYSPRVPPGQLEEIQEIEDPSEPSQDRTDSGRDIYFGKGLCVSCHLSDGTGKPMSGHSPRDFTDPKWQDIRTDGELMWILKNGSPGTGMPRRVGVVISEEEGWNVIQFIRSLRKEP